MALRRLLAPPKSRVLGAGVASYPLQVPPRSLLCGLIRLDSWRVRASSEADLFFLGLDLPPSEADGCCLDASVLCVPVGIEGLSFSVKGCPLLCVCWEIRFSCSERLVRKGDSSFPVPWKHSRFVKLRSWGFFFLLWGCSVAVEERMATVDGV